MRTILHSTCTNKQYTLNYQTACIQDTARQYRTCILDSDMASVPIRSLCVKHLVHNNVYCTSWSCLMYFLCNRYIPPFNFFFTCPFLFFYCYFNSNYSHECTNRNLIISTDIQAYCLEKKAIHSSWIASMNS